MQLLRHIADVEYNIEVYRLCAYVYKLCRKGIIYFHSSDRYMLQVTEIGLQPESCVNIIGNSAVIDGLTIFWRSFPD